MAWQDRDYNRYAPAYGGPPRFGWTGWSVTVWLIVICVVVFLLDWLRVLPTCGRLTLLGSFSAYSVIEHGQVWRFITFQFLHAGVAHILFNMMALYVFGRMVESSLGPRKYLAFYLLCGMGGALLYLALWALGTVFPNVPFLLIANARTPLVGASAGIFGVLVAGAVLAPNQQISLLFPPITLSMRNLALVMLGIAVCVVLFSGSNAGGQAAHLGGAAVGFLLIRRPRLLAWADAMPTGTFQKLAQKRQSLAARRRREQDQALDAEVDRILAKVKAHGLHHLTAGEKRTLQRATERHRDAG
jgi:membrane associated rhomboid family serine protease